MTVGGCPKRKDSGNRGMPYEDQVVRESANDPMNSRMGVCPSVTTHKDQEIDQAVRKYAKDLMNSRMGVCPSAE